MSRSEFDLNSDIDGIARPGDAGRVYAESKLHVVALASP